MIPGASPKAITNVVIKPLERRIREIKGVEHIYGTAMNNVGMINVQYFIGEDRESSNLKLYDKVMQNMDTLPKGIGMPLVKPFDIDIDIPVVTVAFYQKDSTKPSTLKQYHIVREVQQEINALNNVSKSTLKGMHKPQFNIKVDIDKLSSYHLSLGQIAASVKAIATNAPNINAPTSNNSIIVFGVKNAIEDIDDLKDLIIAQYMGSPIYLKNVAKIEYGYDIQHFQNSLISQRDNNSSFDEPVQQVTPNCVKVKRYKCCLCG